MKKKVILVVVAFVLIVLLGVIVFYSKDRSEEMAQGKIVEFLEGYKRKDETISNLLIGTISTDVMSFEGISVFFAEKLDYKINSCKKYDEDVYNLKLEVITIDFEKLFSSSYEETINKYGEEGIADNFLNEMEQNIIDNEYETYSVDCNIVVRKINDEFKIQMDSSFANALTGGMNEYLNSLQGGE